MWKNIKDIQMNGQKEINKNYNIKLLCYKAKENMITKMFDVIIVILYI